MNLTNEEAQEINWRVALALKWSGLESAEAYIAECWPDGLPSGEAYSYITNHGGWFGWPPNARIYQTEPPEAPDKEPVPDFCRDPAAADLVRQEIERRGWDVAQYSESECDGRVWQAYIRISVDTYIGTGESRVSPHHALCLAFLAAHEAGAEEGGEK